MHCTVGESPADYYFKIFNLFIQGETSVWWVAVKDFVRICKRETNSQNTPLNSSKNLIKSKCDCFVKNQFRLYKVSFTVSLTLVNVGPWLVRSQTCDQLQHSVWLSFNVPDLSTTIDLTGVSYRIFIKCWCWVNWAETDGQKSTVNVGILSSGDQARSHPHDMMTWPNNKYGRTFFINICQLLFPNVLIRFKLLYLLSLDLWPELAGPPASLSPTSPP